MTRAGDDQGSARPSGAEHEERMRGGHDGDADSATAPVGGTAGRATPGGSDGASPSPDAERERRREADLIGE